MAQHERDEEQTGEGNENREDGLHRAAVKRHPARRLEQLDAPGSGYPETSGFWHYQQTGYENHVRGPHKG